MMVEELSLNGTWELRDEILSAPLSRADVQAHTDSGWIKQPVPGDIHQGLVAAGRIEPPLLGLNSFDCEWTEHRSWWFRRRFEPTAEFLGADVVELEMNGLDANAEIFLNGVHIGSHPSAFRPFVLDVKPWLRAGVNVLLVRLTSGVETVSEQDVDHCDGVRASTEAANGRPDRGDQRRIFVRKPQFTWGWDWSPRLATTAIGGDVKLRAISTACIRDVSLQSVRIGDQVMVDVTVTVDQIHYTKTKRGTVAVTLTDAGGRSYSTAALTVLRSGLTYVALQIVIDDPLLWWPAGLGDQHRYTVTSELTVDEAAVAYPRFEYGLRFVELEFLDDFAFVINGCKVFARGANWIPANAIYASVTAASYDTLVREARDANFNMLRVWGGGLYEPAAFYEACDRYGIMVWQDFMFGCAPYPDDLPEFRAEIEKEADFQTRRLRRYASLVLWCGNNENTWGFIDWWDERTDGGAYLYNYLLPEIVHRNSPALPYWNSSPYGGERPNDADVGDQHFWGFAMMHPDMETRITPEVYDTCEARFVSEFGYVGAPAKETVLAYLDGAPFDRQGDVWQHHNNAFEKNTVDAGIRKHYVDPGGLAPDDYLLYSGLVQGLMYGYALDSMRARRNCHGSLFWMFADCWGEVGWTIIDGYLRRKPSWYFVRRAYAPLRLICRTEGETSVAVVLANDTLDEVHLAVECGYISFDGSVSAVSALPCDVAPLSRRKVAAVALEDHDPRQGLWFARIPGRPDVPTAIFRACDYRELAVPVCRLTVTKVARDAQSCVLRVVTDGYAHAVYFVLPEGAVPEDSYFDLLPGEVRDISVALACDIDVAAIRVCAVNAAGRSARVDDTTLVGESVAHG